MRVINKAEFCHERLGGQFEKALSRYDTDRRVEVLVDRFFSDSMLRGKEALDVGCGLGYFSRRLKERGAAVIGCDIGEKLLEQTRRLAGCPCEWADALELENTFGSQRFDVVVSSECIEHTPDPRLALRQMAAVLRPAGLLAVSTPNVVWLPAVRLATLMRFRPFDGFENFLSWRAMRKTLEQSGLRIVRAEGLHLFPFQLGLHGLSRWFDKRAQWFRGLMINMCVLAQKVSEK
jgi:2-polyprenyl-3-methyl-5-hydroxy-6-metoxy-1,4-benzoquinol methylase